MRKSGRILCALSIALGGVGAVPQHGLAQVKQAAPSPAPGSLWMYPERIKLQDGSYVTAERGYLFVPVNRKNPKSGVMGVEVYRFRADKTANPATPPLFFLPGGPDFPGLQGNLARPGYYEREVAPYREIADFIVVGQRGIGTSKPTTTCEPAKAVAIDAGLDERARVEAEAARKCREYWVAQGFDIGGMNVPEAAADVNDLRKAFGYNKIQIWGGSFGSHWAIATMRYFPSMITRVVLRGIEGPDNTYDSPTGVANVLQRIGATADTSAAWRGKVPPGGFYKTFTDIIAKLDKAPVMVAVTDSVNGTRNVRVDGDAVRRIAVTGARAWPAMVYALYNGNYTAPARSVINDRTQPGIETGAFYILDCGSGITDEREARFKADPAVAVVGDRNWDYHVACPEWKSNNGNAFRIPFKTNYPLLVVQGDWDTSTPIENSRELMPYWTNSRYILVRGGSHGSLSEAWAASPEFRRELLEFYASGDMKGIPSEVILPPVKWVVPER